MVARCVRTGMVRDVEEINVSTGKTKPPPRTGSATPTAAPPLVLVDGSSYLYRAFHAMPALTNSRGEPTGAVYGVANMLRRLLKDYQPERMAVVFDAPGKTFRDDLYSEYKANRPPMPDPLVAQIEPIHRVVEAMGLPLLMVPGVEADDVIGTLAREAAAQGITTVISTGDKDMAQLVGSHVQLVDTMQDRIYDRDAVVAKFGVPPERIIDFLALVGDTSDNIPGVPGVGPKTAARWLNEFGSLDQLKARASEVPGKAGETLRASLAQLDQARELATIRCDLKLPKHLPDLQRQSPDIERLRALYAQLEFKTWLSELGAASAAGAAVNRDGYQTVLDEAALAMWIGRLERAELITVDTETTSLDAMQAEIVGVSLCVTPGEAAYIPLAHVYPDAPAQLDRAKTLARLKPILEDVARAKIGQNLKYDINVFANHGIHLAGVRYDTMLESYVLDSTATRHDMDSLALKYLGEKTITFEEVAGKGKSQIGFADVAIDKAAAYAAEDADVTRRLHDHLWPRLCETPSLRKVFEEIEMPLVPVLARMERHGVRVDVDLLRTQSLEIERRLMELERRAHDQAGQVFNLASPKQIQEIFFDKLKLPVLKKTPKGQPSTAEEVLQELALDYPLPALILEHRGLAKLKSTYTDKLPEMIDPRSGRVHTSYHQAVAATGRLSSADPNLQNIPVRTAEGRRIRQAFVADAGCRIVSADYSQVELRIMAHLSGDAGLIRAFAGNQDIHRATAAEVFGLALDQVGDEQRRAAKAINFGLIYGMSAFGLARNLKIDRQSAQEYIARYFARYPGVKDYMDRTRALARSQGYVETLFGRRLYLPELSSSNVARQQGAERAAINAPMQGTAADLIKRAMIVIDDWLGKSMPAVRMIMQVHDELVFEVPVGDVEALIEGARQRMAGVAELAVPLVVDVGVGDNWDEAH